MSPATRRRILAILLLGTTACAPASTTERDDAAMLEGPPIRTDEPRYRFEREDDGRELDVEFTYLNRTGRTVHVARCGTEGILFRLEKRVGEAWVTAYEPICPMILVPPFTVAPGEALEGEIVIVLSPGAEPQLQVDEVPGTYRLVLSVHGDWRPEPGELGDPLPLAERESEAFEIEG